MVHCAAYGCNNRNNKKIEGITFHRFPHLEEKRDIWVKNMCIKDWVPTKNDRLCSKHFENRFFYKTEKKVKLLNEAVPTIFQELPGFLQLSTKETQKRVRRKTPESQPCTSTQECDTLRRKKLKKQLFLAQRKNSANSRKLKTIKQSLKRCRQDIASMDSLEYNLQLSLDQDLKIIKDKCSSCDFKMEAVDEDEDVNVLEGKPSIINTNEADVQTEIKTSEEDRECKLYIKNETVDDIEDESGQYCQEIIKCEELIIKHEADDCGFKFKQDRPCNIVDEPDVDICSECTVIVAINDNPVLRGTVDRAAQTVPKGTLALRLSDAGALGMYTLRHLKEGVQLGPYEGHLTKAQSTGGYSWKLRGGKLVDGSDEKFSNYLRYIRYARDLSEQNLVAFQYKGELYYRTCRDIEKGEELLIYFNDNPDEIFCEPVDDIPNEEFYMCQFCQLGLQLEAHRDRHQIFCKIQNDGSYVGFLCKHFASLRSEDEESKM